MVTRLALVAGVALGSLVLHSLVLESPGDAAVRAYEDAGLGDLECQADAVSPGWLVAPWTEVKVDCEVCGVDVGFDDEAMVERKLTRWKPVITRYFPVHRPDRAH